MFITQQQIATFNMAPSSFYYVFYIFPVPSILWNSNANQSKETDESMLKQNLTDVIFNLYTSVADYGNLSSISLLPKEQFNSLVDFQFRLHNYFKINGTQIPSVDAYTLHTKLKSLVEILFNSIVSF